MFDVITIDGQTSSGKSSVGFMLAQRIGYQFIDTGVFYRIVALLALDNNLNTDDEGKLISMFESAEIILKSTDKRTSVFLNGQDVTKDLHTPKINNLVPEFAALAKIREVAKRKQILLAEKNNTVMIGRDIGTAIFPNAKLKFVLTADVETRAKRRQEEFLQNGIENSFQQVLEDLKVRDEKDQTREHSPYKVPEDAIVIDTTHKTIEETVAELLKYYHGLSTGDSSLHS